MLRPLGFELNHEGHYDGMVADDILLYVALCIGVLSC
jgi:hypothetical protein